MLYLQHERYGLTFSSNGRNLAAFVDADFGSDSLRQEPTLKHTTEIVDFSARPDNRQRSTCNKDKSMTNCFITLYGSPIAWLCRKQPAITTSITESEFVAVAEASSLIIFLRELTLEIESTFPSAVPIRENNLSTTTLLQSLFATMGG